MVAESEFDMSDTLGSYSSKVVLTLIVGDRELALSHVGSRMFIVSDECQPIPACDAQLRV